MLPALLVIVLMPVISFAMFKFLFIPMIKEEIPEPSAAAPINPEDVILQTDGGEASFTADFEGVVNNLRGTSMTRFIQVSFTVYSSNPQLEGIVNKNRPRMEDVANQVLGNLTLADLEKREIKNVVRNQLMQGFEHVLGGPVVEEIYFTQFVVQ